MRILILTLLLPTLLFAQELTFRQEFDTIPVEIDGWQPYVPWLGGLSESVPDFKDLDDDGDLDLIAGSNYPILYFENIGSAISPYYSYVQDDIGELVTIGNSAPCLVDIDNDGDLDLFAASDERVWYFENTGSSTCPYFELMTDSLEQIIWSAKTVEFVDIDNDGDSDLFTGTWIGTIRFYRNIGSVDSFYFQPEQYLFEGINVLDDSDPCFCDIDGDNDFDLFIGNKYGNIYYYCNDGDSINYDFTFITDNYNDIDVGEHASPEFADIDGDGDYDLFVGRDDIDNTVYSPGDVYFYENIGTPDSAEWQLVTKNYLSVDDGDRAKINFIDIDGDLDLDLFSGNQADQITYFENIGTITSPLFSWRDGFYQHINVNGCDPFFRDIDADSDPDLFVGEGRVPFPPYPGLYLFQNTGTSTSASFTLISSDLVPGAYAAFVQPELADIDDDGDNDLFIADGYDHFYFSENVGSTILPEFSPPIDNWQGISTRYFSFYDCDNDGDLDLFHVFGDSYFNFYIGIYYNIGTPQVPFFDLQIDTISSSLFYEVGFRGIDVVDIDNDEDGDIFLGVNGNGGLLFFRNTTGDTSAISPRTRFHNYPVMDFSIGPNPANPITWISYNLPYPQKAEIAVYNLLGQKVATLATGLQMPGERSLVWNTTNTPSGVYFIRFDSSIYDWAGRIVVVK